MKVSCSKEKRWRYFIMLRCIPLTWEGMKQSETLFLRLLASSSSLERLQPPPSLVPTSAHPKRIHAPKTYLPRKLDTRDSPYCQCWAQNCCQRKECPSPIYHNHVLLTATSEQLDNMGDWSPVPLLVDAAKIMFITLL